jgi:hypothetical protein
MSTETELHARDENNRKLFPDIEINSNVESERRNGDKAMK